MNEKAHRRSFWYRLVRRDIGRKVVALFLAVLLFAAIDRQVRLEEEQTVRIEYVDHQDVEAREQELSGWVLIVEERADTPKIIAPRGQNQLSFKLLLSGSRKSVQQLTERKRVFHYVPARPGRVPITPDDLDLDKLEAELGPGSKVELLNDVMLVLQQEERISVELTAAHLDVVGTPLRGWKFPEGPKGLLFFPPTVGLVGPSELVNRIQKDGMELFELDVTDRSGTWETPLRFVDRVRENLRLESGTEVRVKVVFEDDLVPVGVRFNKTVTLIVDEIETAYPDVQARLHDQKPRLVAASDAPSGKVMREVELLAPSGEEISGLDKSLARSRVVLVASLADLRSPDAFVLPIHVLELQGFPDRMGVRLTGADVDAGLKEVHFEWVPVE